ncbi:MAG: NAD-dependent deacylase [Desulfobacterales bacterium]|nr:NAD-dependent deacylase [Desulfobacterales bacterium]MCP4159433.1 NAD-dependent deacylase [Deltaproteobacteria bacterium]
MYEEAAELISNAKRVTAFTGAGISVESGIPAFRGEEGLWNKYDPIMADISFFLNNPLESWKMIKEVFYDFFGEAEPNTAHYVLAEMELSGIIKTVITQNVDNLHQESGSKNVVEFHGTSQKLICVNCYKKHKIENIDLIILPPKCPDCCGLLKPDFVFFGEGIPEHARNKAFLEADKSDLFIIVGTTGEVTPASSIPQLAKRNGAKIIEVNIESSTFTRDITDIFLKGKATVELENLMEYL